MLVFISDLHLTDGTTGSTIAPAAFEIFAQDMRDLIFSASWRADGRYRPIERIDLVLLGDTLDVIRSSRWASQSVRPYDGADQPQLGELVTQITTDILTHNESSLAVLRGLAMPGQLLVPPADNQGKPAAGAAGQGVQVAIHYLVGNHDWFFHVAGTRYDAIREAIVRQLGLVNPQDTPFPHDPTEIGPLLDIMRRHRVFARHGDIFDPFNFEGDRSASSLGDAIVIELLNRFPAEVHKRLGDDVPVATLMGLKELDNVRPVLLVPVWLDGLLERTCPAAQMRKQIKGIWDELVDRFLALPFVRARRTGSSHDMVAGMEDLLRFSKHVSIGWASRIVTWLQGIRGQNESSYSPHALAEPDFRSRRAKYVVYGHTHYAECVPLEASHAEGYVLNQVYFNSGTWRRTLRQTVAAPNEHEFVPIDVMTYLTFFQGDERCGRPYETWSGNLGVAPAEMPMLRVDAARQSAAAGPAPVMHQFAPHFSTAPIVRRLVPTRRR
jgi:UDP-2,3-diacylglucosamine pyrophosphatase LpxH